MAAAAPVTAQVTAQELFILTSVIGGLGVKIPSKPARICDPLQHFPLEVGRLVLLYRAGSAVESYVGACP
jgi:hypothetical protein